jgi:Spy/CpxP family protein refolding chaperone
MRSVVKMLLTLGVVALVSSPALAQRPQRPQPGGGPGQLTGAALLANKSVQEELKLNEDQTKKIEDTRKAIDDKFKDDRAKLREIRDMTERREKTAELNKKIGEETTKALSGVLKDDQTKRFKQIEYQVMGVRAFSNEDIAKTLKFTDDQKADIKKITEDYQKDMQGLFQPGGNREEAQKKREELRKSAMEKLTKVLTSDQKKSWEEMTGAPFQIKFDAPRRPQRDTARPQRDTASTPDK